MRDINRDAKYEDLMKLLAEKKNPNLTSSLFKTMRELLCFCAVLGYHEGKRVPLSTKTTEIPGRVFENSDFAMDLIYLLALCESKSGDILKPENESDIIKIFEEYACGGLETLQRWISETPSDAYGDQAIINALYKYDFMTIEGSGDGEEITIEI